MDIFTELAAHAGVIDAHLGVVNRRLDLDLTAQCFTRAIGTAVNQVTNHVQDIVVRAPQPILQSDEVRAHILCRTGNKAQQLGQTAQHFHLRSATCGGLVFTATA